MINLIAEKAGITRDKAETVVNTIFDSMVEALMKDDRIEIRGFGSFVNRQYGAYKGRNPRTGQVIDVEEKKLPFFKVGKELKERRRRRDRTVGRGVRRARRTPMSARRITCPPFRRCCSWCPGCCRPYCPSNRRHPFRPFLL